jgi:hypothetical protein
VIACATATVAHSEPLSAKKPVSEYDDLNNAPPRFYLANGDHNACGEGCDEWIAAEGYFDAGAPARLFAFLKAQPGRNLPIYFQSPGGFIDQAMEIGRYLRDHQITTGVAKTLPEVCAAHDFAACRAAKRSGMPVQARLVEIDGACNSACVYALIGGKVRHVPPGARLGVHASKVVGGRSQADRASLALAADRARLASSNVELRSYIRAMQIDEGLFKTILTVPHEHVRLLRRDEIARFGIDPRPFQETRWTPVEASRPQGASVVKVIAHATGSDGKAFRTSVIRLSCDSAAQVKVSYIRSRVGEDAARSAGSPPQAVSVSLVAGSQSLVFPSERALRKTVLAGAEEASDGREASTGIEFFGEAATLASLDLVEDIPHAGPQTAPRRIKLSTAGLPEAVAAMRRWCSGQRRNGSPGRTATRLP